MLYPDIRQLESVLNTVMVEGRETEIETAPVIDKSSKNAEAARA